MQMQTEEEWKDEAEKMADYMFKRFIEFPVQDKHPENDLKVVEWFDKNDKDSKNQVGVFANKEMRRFYRFNIKKDIWHVLPSNINKWLGNLKKVKKHLEEYKGFKKGSFEVWWYEMEWNDYNVRNLGMFFNYGIRDVYREFRENYREYLIDWEEEKWLKTAEEINHCNDTLEDGYTIRDIPNYRNWFMLQEEFYRMKEWLFKDANGKISKAYEEFKKKYNNIYSSKCFEITVKRVVENNELMAKF